MAFDLTIHPLKEIQVQQLMESWWLQSKSPCNDLYINIVWMDQHSIKGFIQPFNPNAKSFTSPNTPDFHAETHLNISHSMWLLIQCFGVDSIPSVKRSPDLWGISLLPIQYGPAKLLPPIQWDIISRHILPSKYNTIHLSREESFATNMRIFETMNC